MKVIGKGAEAIIYKDKDTVKKDRVKKNYRIEEIDNQLRKSRTRREAKILQKLKSLGFPAPRLIETDRLSDIRMDFIDGTKIRDVMNKDNCKVIGKELGRLLKILHDNGIIHGDLTTSNMIQKDETIYFIDFGLSYFSDRVEDRAVDLHLMRQALDSSHHTISEQTFKAVTDSYADKATLRRFETVEQRGRNKAKH